ncbi:hypothetical protein PM082_009403 [Marasmius tenuissimus]|nr:hypothetical protein PM082_009403 [Marasmius tenuissimus]
MANLSTSDHVPRSKPYGDCWWAVQCKHKVPAGICALNYNPPMSLNTTSWHGRECRGHRCEQSIPQKLLVSVNTLPRSLFGSDGSAPSLHSLSDWTDPYS